MVQTLSRAVREAVTSHFHPEKSFFAEYFGDVGYPRWCVDALRSVGVDLLEGREGVPIIEGNGAKWEYAQ